MHHIGSQSRTVVLCPGSESMTVSPPAASARSRNRVQASIAERDGIGLGRVTSESELGLWGAYESLFNLIFEVAPLTVMCPYDARSLDPSILDVARRTHPSLVEGTRLEKNEAYIAPEEFVLGG
jgi:hypothetical protein